MLVPVLLAGSRAAWLMFALVVAVFAWREAKSPWRFAGWSLCAAAAAVIVAVVALQDSRAFGARIQRSLLALNGSEQSVDEASAGRVRIWTTAARMSIAHPLNGVGVRAFRFAYPRYAGANDSFVAPDGDEGAAHAHQIVLEVTSETGAIGLAFWLAGAFFALRAWWRAGAAAVKIFPASQVGPGYLKDLRGPFPDIAAIPSGGVDLEGASGWLRAGSAAVSVGSPLLGDALRGGDFGALRERTAAFVAACGQVTT